MQQLSADKAVKKYQVNRFQRSLVGCHYFLLVDRRRVGKTPVSGAKRCRGERLADGMEISSLLLICQAFTSS